MKKLLPCTALVMCAGMACAQAEERNDWHFNIGAMYEIENVEGYGEDMDGLAEPGNDSNLLIVFYVQRAFTDKQQIKRKAQSFD